MPDWRLHPLGGLPVELWIIIIDYLPRQSLRACLQVCRVWHDIAVRPLFSTVKLCFLGLLPSSFNATSSQHPGDNKEVLRFYDIASDSIQILNHMVNTPSFARAVKRLFVNISKGPLDTEKRQLMRALDFMPRLSSFELTSASPSPILLPELFGAVIKRPLLSCLCFPYCGAEEYSRSHNFRLPRRITTLKLSQSTNQEWGAFTVFDFLSEATPDATLNSLELRLFSTQGAPSWQSFAYLRELSLWSPVDIDALQSVFHHSHLLESLALHRLGEGLVEVLTPLLAGSTELLPRLSCFILTTDFLFMEELNAVHDFLIRRTAMKRLGLRFECEPEDVFIIWQVLVEMKSLEGLWLEVLSNRLIDIVPLMPVLPASLRALMFSALVHPDDAEEFLDCIFELPHLTTLCLPSSSPFSRFSRFNFIPLDSDDARTFGGPGTDKKWSELKIATLDPEDFDDPNVRWFTPIIMTWLPPPPLRTI